MKEVIELSSDQKNAIKTMFSFLKSSETAFLLVGNAGSGKTTVISEFIDLLQTQLSGVNIVDIALCAPTHQALSILSSKLGIQHKFSSKQRVELNTLHSLLNLRPDITLEKLDYRNLEFNSSNVAKRIRENTLIICDESSMINDPIHDQIIEVCKLRRCKVIFVGDDAQLSPVSGIGKSKVFKTRPMARLTTNQRQLENSPLLSSLNILRKESITQFKTEESEETSIYTYNTESVKDYLTSMSGLFTLDVSNRDCINTKVLCYTNKRVDDYNRFIRKTIFKGNDTFYPGDFLKIESSRDRVGFNNHINKNVFADSVSSRSVSIMGNYYLTHVIKVIDSDGRSKELFVIDNDEVVKNGTVIAEKLEKQRLEVLHKVKSNPRNSYMWSNYFTNLESFHTTSDLFFEGRVIKPKTVSYGYAETVHKAQGSQFNNIFLDIKNINRYTKDEERRQLQYVGLSRTKYNAFILQ